MSVSIARWLTPHRQATRRLGRYSRSPPARAPPPSQRVEPHERDPLARLRSLDRPRERPLDLRRREIEHAGDAAAARPGPADLEQSPRGLDVSSTSTATGSALAHAVRPEHEVGSVQQRTPPGPRRQLRARQRHAGIRAPRAQLALADAPDDRDRRAPAPPRPRRRRAHAARLTALTRHGSSPRRPAARRPARVTV